MICKNCGNEVLDFMKFCTVCGTPVEAPEEETPVSPYPENQTPLAAQVATEEAPVEEAPVEEAPVAEAPAPVHHPRQKKAGKGAKIAAIVLAAVLAVVLAAGGVVGYLFYTDYTQLEANHTELQDRYADLEMKQEELSANYAALESENENLAYQVEDANTNLAQVQSEYESLMVEYGDIVDDYYSWSDEYEFYHRFGVYCSEMNDYYHTYDCPDWDREGFWLFNVDYAIAQDYTACPNCH